jgi:hypothetical protein
MWIKLIPELELPVKIRTFQVLYPYDRDLIPSHTVQMTVNLEFRHWQVDQEPYTFALALH